MLTNEDPLLPAWQEWKANPTPETSQKMLQAVRPVLDTAVRAYGGQGSSPTLRSYAKQLALESLEKYKPDRGKIKPYLMSHLQRLYRINARQQQIVSVPEAVSMARINLQKNERELEDRLGRPPSDQELADYSKISIRKLKRLRMADRPLASGQLTDPTTGEVSSTVAVTSLADKNYETALELLYNELNPRQKFILERMAGLHGHRQHSAREIAKALKITPAAVSQQVKKIQGTLQRYIDFLQGSGGA